MRSKYLTAILVSLVLLLAAPSAIGARNKVDQDNADADAKQKDIIENDADLYFYGYYEDRLAWSGAVCQLNVVGDVWLAAMSLTSALAVIDDQDTRLLFPEEIFGLENGNGRPYIVLDLSAETSDSTCDTSVGPVDIFVTGPSAGFGNPAPMGGTVSEAVGALGNGPRNKIDQDYAESDAKQDDIIRNDGDLTYEYGDDSAYAGAICQANIVGRAALWAFGSTSLDSTILDGDTTLAPAPGNGGGGVVAQPESIDADLQIPEIGLFANLTITNDHTATASCLQPIESITISIGGRQDLPPQS